MLLLGEAVQDVNAIGHANTDDQRQGHDVGRVERQIENAHHPEHPQRAKGHRNQREHDTGKAAKMDEHHDGNGD